MERLIFHIDVNSAFLSWEAARRVKEGLPDIRLIPSAIGGSESDRRGIILAKSIPAKQYGVTTGEPVAMALRKCPGLFLARPDFELYRENSRAFMDICREYAPVVSQVSIDECFCDMTGTGKLYPDPQKTAHEIKNRIKNELGFTVNVGIGSNKLLAKMASDFEKPDKVHTLFSDEVKSKMWPLPVNNLLYAGKATALKLSRIGVMTIGDLAKLDEHVLKVTLGEKMAKVMHDYANGIDDSPVESESAAPKGYSMETTLKEDVVTKDGALSILLMLVDSVAARMRAGNDKAGCIGVSIRSYDFRNRSHQKKLDNPTDVTDEIYEVVKELFVKLWDGVTPLRLLGVSLTDVSADEFTQLSLFDDGKRERRRNLDRALDDIKNRYGRDSVYRASYGHKKD